MFKKQKTPPQAPGRRRVSPNAAQPNAVFSYHAVRSSNDDVRGRQMQPQEKPRRKRRNIFAGLTIKPKSILATVGILVAFGLLIALGSTPKIVVTGDESAQIFAQDTSRYADVAQQLFAQSRLSGNKLTVDTASIADEMKRRFPEVREVSVSLPIVGTKPTVYIQPASPQIILQTSQGSQYVLDSSGRVLMQVSPALKLPTGEKALPVIIDESGLEVNLSQTALPRSDISFITEVVGQLKLQKISVERWTLPAGTSELRAKVAGGPYYVKFNLRGKAREESGAFIATRKYLNNQQIVPTEYIDVRVSGRTFYK